MTLAAKTCVPCQGRIPALDCVAAEKLRSGVPQWNLESQCRRLVRKFSVGDFASALAFVNRLGAIAEAEGHHPDVSFGWGYVDVTLYTHKIHGLHENDFIVAAKIDAAFADNGFGDGEI